MGDQAAGERGGLDAAAVGRAVHVHGDAVVQAVHQPGRAACEADHVGARRVGAAAELAEVATAAERRPVPAQLDALDRVVGDREFERCCEFVAQPGIDRVPAMWAIERDRERVVVPLGAHHRPVGGVGRVQRTGAPRGELAPGLEGGVGGRLECEPGLHTDRWHHPQQDRERRRCDGSVLHHVERALDVGLTDHGVCAVGPVTAEAVADPQHHDRQRSGSGDRLDVATYDDRRDAVPDDALVDEGRADEVVVLSWSERQVTDRPSVEPVDLRALWWESGAQWLTDPGVGVPLRLARAIRGLVVDLDRRGAGLASLVGAGGLGVLGERAAALGLGRSGRTSAGGATRFVRCADEWLALSLARPDDIAMLPALLDLDAATVDPDDPWPVVARVSADRSASSVVERAHLLGLACARVGHTAPQGVRHHQLGGAPPTPLTDLTVVNLAALWAGPLAADVLARLGAKVITVESTGRPDGSRATPAFFESLHGRTESVALALDTIDGRRQLRELLAHVDVVIEGSRPRALAQMGIDAATLVAVGPRIWVSITAHGRDEAHAHLVGYGDDAAAAGGCVGWVGGEPRFIADAVADPLAGLTAAIHVAALADSGGRWLVDVSLSGLAASIAPRSAADWADPLDDPRPPRPRSDPGAALPLGRDTARVLGALGVA